MGVAQKLRASAPPPHNKQVAVLFGCFSGYTPQKGLPILRRAHMPVPCRLVAQTCDPGDESYSGASYGFVVILRKALPAPPNNCIFPMSKLPGVKKANIWRGGAGLAWCFFYGFPKGRTPHPFWGFPSTCILRAVRPSFAGY